MKKPQLINSKRVRKIPSQFSWIDHRLVRNGHIQKCRCTAQGLYLFLVTVGDSQGMSYYKDRSIEGFLGMDSEQLFESRVQLIQFGLISYQNPYYQVLSLDDPEKAQNTPSGVRDLQTVGHILDAVMNGGKAS